MAESIVLEHLLSATENRHTITGKFKRQRIYILPTRPGILLCFVLITMLLGAINYSNSMAYILTFLLGSIYMVCMLHTYRNLSGLIINGSAPRPVFAGETANFPVLIDNRAGPSRTALEFVLSPARKNKRSTQQNYQPVPANLLSGDWQQFEIPIPAGKRGLLKLERIMVSTCFPLGLFRAWSYLELGQECVVYPKPEGVDKFPVQVMAEEQGIEGPKPGTNDFDGFRQYHPGDSIRNIAWKAVAREQPLLVKRFSGEGSHTLIFTWNDVVHIQDTERRLSQLCRWILLAENQGWMYGFDIPGNRIDPAQGLLHRNRCLEILARFTISHAY